MTFSTVYAVISTANVDAARDWYERLFGRAADREPMAGVLEWYLAAAACSWWPTASAPGARC
jgi:hypothetical protein